MFLILIFVPFLAYSQTDTEFWFAAPEVNQSHADRPIFLRMTAMTQAATVTISQPANPGFSPIVVTIPALTSNAVNLTNWIDIIENKPANVVLNYGLHIVSTAPITAYYDEASTINPEIFTLKGKNSLGTYFLTPFQNFTNAGNIYFSGFNIVAVEDSTVITIVPSKAVTGHPANVPFTIYLNKGQTYTCNAAGLTASDRLAGSVVTSNKPIALTLFDDSLSGTAWGGCADLCGDQCIPVAVTGKKYIVVRGFLNGGTEKVFIMATQNNTDIFINGSSTPSATINLGQTYMYTISNASAYIESSEAVYVLHMSGFGCELGMPVLPSIECTGSSVIGFTRSSSEFFGVILLTKNGNQSNFVLNGNSSVITPTSFQIVPGTASQWVAARIDLSSSVTTGIGNLITNGSGKFHLGIINGGSVSGCKYGYFSDFSSLYLGADIYKCPLDTVSLDAGPNRLSYLWSTGQTTQKILVNSPGTYAVTVTDINCLLYDTIVVNNNPIPEFKLGSDTLLCNGQSLTLAASSTYSNVFWSTGAQTQSIQVDTAGLFWARATDGSGCRVQDSLKVKYSLLTAGPDQIRFCDDSVQLNASGALTYLWSPSTGLSNPNIPNPKAAPLQNTTYTVSGGGSGQNLVYNGDFDLGNIGFTSQHIYSSSIHNEGYFGVVQNAQSWHPLASLCYDHTSGSGYMMVVNGAMAPNLEVWGQTVTVNPNTDYAFSCWVSNWSNIQTLLCKLQFSINGNLLGNIFSSDTVQCVWKQFYVVWNSGNNTVANIKIMNQNTTAGGNDFALDDISLGPISFCSDSLTVKVVKSKINPQDTTICFGQTLTLKASIENLQIPWIYTQNFESQPWPEWNKTANFSYNSTNVSGPFGNETMQLNLNNLPPHDSVSLSFDLYIFDSWDGNGIPAASEDLDLWDLNIDGNSLIHTTFVNAPISLYPGFAQSYPSNYPASNIPMTGSQPPLLPVRCLSNAYGTGLYKITRKIPHNANQILLGFSASNLQNLCDESWSIDNVKLTLTKHDTTLYQWNTGQTSPSISVSPAQTTNYTVTVTYQGHSCFRNSLVHVIKAPVNLGNDTSFCPGTFVTIHGPPGYSSYLWSNGASGNPSITVNQPGLYWLEVTDANGCKGRDSIHLSLNNALQVTISPPTASICSGESLLLHGLSNAGGTNWQWSTSATSQNINVSPTITTNYSLVGHYTTCTDTAFLTVVVKPSPQPQILPLNPSLCAGDSVQLTASSNLANSAFIWSTGSANFNLWVNPVSTSTYTVTATKDGCSATASNLVTVNPIPVVVITPDSITACQGDSILISASCPFPGTTYQWNAGFSSASQLIAANSTTTYTVTTTLQACHDTASLHLTVLLPPVISLSQQPTVVCKGDSVTVTALSGDPATTWLWDSGETSAAIKVLVDSTTNIVVWGSLEGCGSMQTLNLTPLPLPVVSISAPQNWICYGDTITLSATTTPAGLGLSWNSGQSGSMIQVHPTISKLFIATAMLGSCPGSDTLNLLVKPLPTPTINPPDISVCLSDSVPLTASSAFPTSTYLWSTGSANLAIQAQPLFSHWFTVSCTYDGCSDTSSAWVAVIPHPLINLGPDDYLCKGNSVTLVAPPGIQHYIWSDGSMGQSLEVTQPGIFWVEAGNENCTSTDTIVLKPCSEIWAPNVFTPNHDGKNDAFKVVYKEIYHFEMSIYTRWGEKVYKSNDPEAGWDGTFKGGECPGGVYFFVVNYIGIGGQGGGEQQQLKGTVTLLR
ncbi:MAG: gliding motility-associated C-terminal domain-containing protein [Bacteroidota bacterium]